MVFVNDSATIHSLEPESNLRPVRETCWASMLGGQASMLG